MQARLTYKSYRQLLAERQGKGFSEHEVTNILKQVLPQLAALHAQGKAHGAISLDTLVQRQADRLSILLQVPSNQFDLSKDLFDLGVAIAQLLAAQPSELLVNPYGSWQWEEYCLVSDQFIDFLNRALSSDPRIRYANASEMLEALGITSESYLPPASINYPPNYSPNYLLLPVTAPARTSQLVPWQWASIGVGAGLLLLLASLGVSKLSSPQQQSIVEPPTSSTASTPVSTTTPVPTVTVTATPTPTLAVSSPTTQNSPKSGSGNIFENARFPQYECGDPLPTNPNAYPINLYPVFIDFSDRNLQIARSQYCQDAIEKPRKDSGKLSVQVASFVDSERANAFRDFLSVRVGTVEVGAPTVITRDRASTFATQISTERINFATGSTSFRIERSINANQSRRYLLNCIQGQRFAFILLHGNANVSLYSPGGRYLGGTYRSNEYWTIALQESGDYIIEVSSQSKTAYGIDVEVL